MTTRQLKNKLVRILSLPTNEISVRIDADGCYIAETMMSSVFSLTVLNFIQMRFRTRRISSNQIILSPEEWESILTGIEVNDIPNGRTISTRGSVQPIPNENLLDIIQDVVPRFHTRFTVIAGPKPQLHK